MQVISTNRKMLRIDAPEWFALDAFRAAVERGTSPEAKRPLASFHRHGDRFAEFSDVFLLFDAHDEVEPDGTARWIVESSDLLDEPGLEAVYKTVVRVTQQLGIRSGMLWITNVGLSSA